MHITKISNNNKFLNYGENKSPAFKGVSGALIDTAGKFFQVCDEIPMIGVSFTDTVATNVPRTIVDLHAAGIPAAAETARREFSGLFVNCLIPGAFVWGAAKLTNNGFMNKFKTEAGKTLDMSSSWANEEAIKNLTGVWQDYSGIKSDISTLSGTAKKEALEALEGKNFKAKGFVKSVLSNIEGLNGINSYDKLSDHKNLINKAASILEPIMEDNAPKNLIERFKFRKVKNNALKQAYDTLVNGSYQYKNEAGELVMETVSKNGFKAAQTLKFKGESIGSDLRNLLRDTVDIGSALKKSKDARLNPNDFIKKASGLVGTKSLIGLGVVIPLAMSMQYINRAITRHKYKKTGAPIYKDFENKERVLTNEEKKELNMRKPLAVASIVALAAISMGKTFPKSLKEAGKMLQFNTKFPTLNQCRVIATATFASRMMASEDPNELRESTVRDLASFSGLYFLGDYAEKLAATGIQKFSKAGRENRLQMFNRTVDPKEYKTTFQKLKGWVKDTSIKSFDEIPKEFKHYRSLAKIGGLGFSIALLGILLPKYNKYVTNKKEALRNAEENQKQEQTNTQANNINNLPFQARKFLNNPAFAKVASQCIQK